MNNEQADLKWKTVSIILISLISFFLTKFVCTVVKIQDPGRLQIGAIIALATFLIGCIISKVHREWFREKVISSIDFIIDKFLIVIAFIFGPNFDKEDERESEEE